MLFWLCLLFVVYLCIDCFGLLFGWWLGIGVCLCWVVVGLAFGFELVGGDWLLSCFMFLWYYIGCVDGLILLVYLNMLMVVYMVL